MQLSFQGVRKMDAMEAILTRRSIRRFSKEKVPDEMIDRILEAGMYAPSAGNEQAWQFIVVKEKDTLQKISELHPYAQMAREASHAIVVCGDLSKERYKGFFVQDCSAATQNILLAAHSLGIGAVWCAIYPRDKSDEFAKLFKLPENIVPFSLVPIGFPAEKKEKPNRFDKSLIHMNRW